jgi:hypothetical protein
VFLKFFSATDLLATILNSADTILSQLSGVTGPPPLKLMLLRVTFYLRKLWEYET